MRSVIAFLVRHYRDGHPELCNLVAADAAACCAPSSPARPPKKAVKHGDDPMKLWRLSLQTVAVRSADGAEEFKTIATFCGLGLLLSLVAALLYGLDPTAF